MDNIQDPRPRHLQDLLDRALESFPVVVVTGSRQTGKSTLVHRLHGRQELRLYQSLDDFDILERARVEPEALVRSAARLTLDEVQRAPELLQAVKMAVDERREPGRFLLTGSANLLLMRKISESLAGRAIYLTLWPMTRSEREGHGRVGLWPEIWKSEDSDWPTLLEEHGHERADWRDLARIGGYPVPALHTDTAAVPLWHEGYVRTYLERDLQEITTISSLTDFRRLMRAACLRLGNVVNQSEISRDVGIPQSTIHRYFAVLEASYQLVRVPAYAVNRTKRLIKGPKLFWCDTGLAMHLSGEEEPRGAHLENLILQDLLVWRDAALRRPEILYWRTTTQAEVDFVIEYEGRLLPIEIKSTSRPRYNDTKSLRLFREEYAKTTRHGLLLYDGEDVRWIADGILAVPWWKIL